MKWRQQKKVFISPLRDKQRERHKPICCCPTADSTTYIMLVWWNFTTPLIHISKSLKLFITLSLPQARTQCKSGVVFIPLLAKVKTCIFNSTPTLTMYTSERKYTTISDIPCLHLMWLYMCKFPEFSLQSILGQCTLYKELVWN